MTVLADDRNVARKEGELVDYDVVQSDIVYKGSLVSATTGGYAQPASDSNQDLFLGVAAEKADNSSGSNGDIQVRIWKKGTFEFVMSGAAQANIGDPAYVVDDQTVATTTTNGILAGYIVGIESGIARVRIDRAVK